ncbi:MAG: DUF4031 domain-containing protein [Acidimicrobiales bacterium]
MVAGGGALTVVVDEAIWRFRGRRWAHLACDGDLDELHRFAAAIGVHRVSFGGDHYDVTAEQRVAALAAGAVPVGARELVRLLRAAGLRRRPGDGAHHWSPLAHHDELDATGVGAAVRAALPWLDGHAAAAHALQALAQGWSGGGPIAVRVLARPGEVAVLLVASTVPTLAGPLPAEPPPPITAWLAWPAADHRLLEVFMRPPDVPMTTR